MKRIYDVGVDGNLIAYRENDRRYATVVKNYFKKM